jgi:glycosyltransferase involved in cell wall biosynthesis
MINIISKSYLSSRVSGPKKVIMNLVKGLDQLGYPYVINKDLSACKRLWIHDDIQALKFVKDLPSDIRIVVGPNLFIKPSDIPKDLDITRTVFTYPSNWIKDFWKKLGYVGSFMEVWPAGIDTDEFNISKAEKKFVMLYYKQRTKDELKLVEDFLHSKKIEYKLIVYHDYREKEFRDILSQTKYGIWLGRHESQGIALEEALACGVPLIVWDVKNLGHWAPTDKEKKLFTEEENNYVPVTSAEYFDETCGIKVNNFLDLIKALDFMEKRWKNFNPRKYIIENLDYKKQARDFLEIYDKYFGLSVVSGYQEKIMKFGNWINNRWSNKITTKLKDLLKNIINI